MADLDAIRERHPKEVGTFRGTLCSFDGQPWPCDTAQLLAVVDGLRNEIARLWRADRAVHSAYDGECEHGYGPPATLCPNADCPDRELAEAWSAALADTGTPLE